MTDQEPEQMGRSLGERVARLQRSAQRPVRGRLAAPPGVAEEAVRVRREALRALWWDQVPDEFVEARLEDMSTDPVAAKALGRWSLGNGGPAAYVDGVNLVVFGPVGVGKTHAAVAACRAPFAAHPSILFWPVRELLRELDWHLEEHTATMYQCQRVRLLVLDDLGTELDSDWARGQLYELLNRRWLDNLPTVATTNLTSEDLCEAVGERTYSRLADAAVAVRLTGVDRRRNG